MDAVARGLSGAVSRRGIEDGEQQRETEKPETGFSDDLRKGPSLNFDPNKQTQLVFF